MKYTFEQKHVLIMGLGLNTGGVGAILYLLDKGASLIITDTKSEEELQNSITQVMLHPHSKNRVQWVLGEHREQDFISADYIVRNPAVSLESHYIQLALQHNKPVITDIEIFFDAIRSIYHTITIIGVTGTRGKSTTTSWIYHILVQQYGEDRVHIGGNIRKSVMNILPIIKSGDYIVLELSSFQLETLEMSPHIAVFTSFFPDHLNRHKTMENYFEIKSHLFRYQSSHDIAVLNIDSEYIQTLQSQLESNIATFSKYNMQADCYLEGEWIYRNKKPYIPVSELLLSQPHNCMNAMASILATQNLVSDASLKKGLVTFSGVPGRQEYIGTVKEVTFINDTTSTTITALLVALESFQDRPVYLLCGGNNKNLDYSEFGPMLARTQVKSIHFLPGDASEEMILSMEKAHSTIPYTQHTSLKSAFDSIVSEAQPNSTILFSPGGTSFGLFANEFDRGDQYLALFKTYAEQNTL